MTPSRFHRVAHAYAQHGWAVFPCAVRGKTPLTEHGCKDASRDPGQLAAWWDRWPEANIGIATGAPSRLLVVDLDGHAGPANWSRLTEQHNGVPHGLAASTGSGGIHILFVTTQPVQNTASRLGGSIDTRGDGGYIIAAPSIHPCGQRYQWLNHEPVVEAPSWLVDLLQPPPEPAPAPARRWCAPPADDASRYGTAALQRALDDLAHAGPGGRNDALNRAAYSLAPLIADGHLPQPLVESELHAVAVQIGLTQRETTATIRSGLAAGHTRPGTTPPLPPASRAPAWDAPRWQPPRWHPPRWT